MREKEASHDIMVELGTERVHDTVREIETVTVVLNADGTEHSRTTEKSKEHLRGRTTTNEKARVLESTVQCEARKEDKQTVAAPPGGSPIKPYLWGTLAGIVLTTAAIVVTKLRKTIKKWHER
ncbi:MAG: hypothetical protein KBT28_02215 [Bacteroidales bacterium]|nr:hypothetical protein [Candidatus Colimorpha merdihippi]